LTLTFGMRCHEAMRTWALLFLFAAGCFSSHTGEIETARKAEIYRIRDLTFSKMVMPTCVDPPTGQLQPPGQRRVGDTDVLQPCGMVIAQLTANSSMQQFIAQVCGGVDDAACLNRFEQMFLARLRDRYGFADWNEVSNKCTAYPVDCKQWSQIEFWTLESHNANVTKWGEAQMERTNEQYQAQFEQAYVEELEHRQRVAAVFQGFADGLAASAPAPTVHCTSNTYGSMTTTTCN
jgi:hypothetical protein